MALMQTRRRVIAGLAAAGAAGLLAPRLASAAEERLETTAIRMMRVPSVCHAPQYIAEELLRAEGLTEISFLPAETSAEVNDAIARGTVDFNSHFGSQFVAAIDAGAPITILAGVHVGCFELFAQNGIRNVTDLKGKSIAIGALGSSPHLFVSIMVARVGLDPAKDIRWIESVSPTPIELFADGKADAFLGLPPEAQEAHARRLGHVLVNSAVDDPWSQYFCCMWAGNREFVRKHPVATKRVLRAILKAEDICASDPERVAKRLVDGRFTPAPYEYALQAMRDIPYDKWREYDAEDTVRFYALKLHEAGMVKLGPQKIIAEGTDWRFLNELKRELKA
jgi:NitT/TauT family transport system substrate-binding protein